MPLIINAEQLPANSSTVKAQSPRIFATKNAPGSEQLQFANLFNKPHGQKGQETRHHPPRMKKGLYKLVYKP